MDCHFYEQRVAFRLRVYSVRKAVHSACETVVPKKEPDLSRLSETDIEELEQSFAERGQSSFNDLCEEAHREPAFLRSSIRKMTEEDLAEDGPILLE